MVCDDTKRVVIIRNISSNIVEEAILVLKDKNTITNKNKNKNKTIILSSANSSRKANNYLLREAEDIINNFVNEKGLKDGLVHELNLKPFNPKKKLINTFINLALVASIALLFFLVAKIF